jgi:hypothetical protein
MRRFELELFEHDGIPYRARHFDSLEEARSAAGELAATQVWQIRDHQDSDRVVAGSG